MLFSVETWVVTPRMGWYLGEFQDQVARRLVGGIPWQRLDRRWKYISSEAEISEAGFETM